MRKVEKQCATKWNAKGYSRLTNTEKNNKQPKRETLNIKRTSKVGRKICVV